jgi:hypothetical protein
MSLASFITFAWLCLLSLPAFAAVGSVDSLEGDVRIVTGGRERAAAAGAEVNEGDTIKTAENAWVLLAMSDGASLTLRPNTQLRIDAYRYNPDGNASENSGVLALVKGALRSITGYIGSTNRTGYSITTPTAFIGIRGTDHEPAYYAPGEQTDREPGTYDKVNDGESFIRNSKGQVAIKRGQYGFVHHQGRFAPSLLRTAPAFYQRHAEFDRRAAVRRQEFHRRFEERYRQHVQERAQRVRQLEDGKGQAREAEKAERLQRQEALAKQRQERQEKQQQWREQAEKRQQERQAQQQQQRREQMQQHQRERQAQQQKQKEKIEEERLKRQQEHAKRLEEKKRHE